MSLKRLAKKNLLLGPIMGHIMDAYEKKLKTKKTFTECLEESVNETIKEDLPGTSHIYQMGNKDGRVVGTKEQAARDEEKMKKVKEEHIEDKRKWEEINKEKDQFIDDLVKDKMNQEE